MKALRFVVALGTSAAIIMQFPEKFGMKPTATSGVRY